MTIDGIRKSFGIKKSEKKAEKKPQIPEVKTEKAESGKKINGATLATAMAAALMIPSMTSCVEQNQEMGDYPGVTAEQFEAARKENNENQQRIITLLTSLVDLATQNNNQNKEYFQQLLDSNKQILTALMSMQNTLESIEATLNNVSSILYDIYENDTEMLAKISAILSSQNTDSEKLDQLIELNQEQNAWLSSIVTMQQVTADINQEISDKIDSYFQQYTEGQLTHTQLMNQIIAEIKNNGNITQEISNKIDQIMSGDEADSVKLDKIIELLESIDSKLGKLLQEVTDLGDNFVNADGEKLGDILTNLVEKFEDHSITSNALAAEILNEVKQSNINDEAILAKFDAILEQLQNNDLTGDEAISQITALLAQINNKMNGVLTSLGDISTKLDNLYNQNEENRNDTYEILANINNGIGSIGSKIDKIIQNQEEGNEIALNILDKLDEAVGQLGQISSETITIEQLKEMFGPMFDEIYSKLDNIKNGQVSVGDVMAIAESMKVDLTVTNALLETINTTIQNKNFTGEFSGQLGELADIMNKVLAEIENGNVTEAEGLAQVLEKLASMEGSLEAIQAAADEINNNFKTYMSQAQNYGQKWTEQFQQLIDGQVNKDMFNAYTDLFTETAEQAQQAQEARLLAIQAAIENISGGNGQAVDIDELISKLPNYTDILNDIRNAIGDLVTKADLEAYGESHKTDLTTTNALLETINTTIQNKNFTVNGGGTAGTTDLAEVISAINRIYDNLTNAQFPTKEQVQVLLDYVNQIAANASSGTATRAIAQADAANARRELYAQVNEYNRMIAEKTGQKATYLAPEFDYTGKNFTV